MSQGTEARRADLIEGILERARWRLGEASLPGIEAFLIQYFARVPLADVEGETPDALFGLAYSHFRLAAQRVAGRAKLRCYDPSVDEDGWRSEQSVLQVITDDMPFLVDSVAADLGARDLAIHRIIHPIFDVVRDGGGQWQGLAAADEESGALAESFMHFEFTRRTPAELAGIAASVNAVLEQVRAAVDDWRAMAAKMIEIGATLAPPPEAAPADFEEIRAFLTWLGEGHFTFLGYREYFSDSGAGVALARAVPGSGLGLLRAPEASVFEDLIEGAPLPPAAAAFVARNETLLVTKTTRRSPVHRPVFMDAIVIRRWDRTDDIVGTHLFVGLFTASAYTASARRIPLLRRKFDNALANSGFDPRGHDGRALVNIIETFPRDELFQIADDQLLEIALGILSLQQRPRTALFLRRDELDRFIVAQVFIPRDRYSTSLRLRVQRLIERAFAGTVTAHNSLVGDGALARLHLFVTTLPGQIPAYDEKLLEQGIVAATRGWADHLGDALITTHGEAEGRRLLRRYGDAFPPGYQDRFDAEQAVADIDTVEETLARGSLGLTLYRAFGASETEIRFKVFHPGQPIPLSQILPVLEHLGLTVIDEVPHAIAIRDHAEGMVMIHDFGLEAHSGRPVDLAAVRAPFHDAFHAVWSGEAESDALNALVLAAGLTWRRIVIVRAYVRYLRQVGIGFTQSYIQQTLVGNAEITRLIVELFATLFDPEGESDREARAATLRADIDAQLDEVASADQDRILRRVLNLVEVDPAHQCLPHRHPGRAPAFPVVEAGQPPPGGAAAATPVRRGFRLLAAGRGRAPARRQGGARRHPLVRPPGGFPHRDPRPDQGADGQERGDRPGWRQGRLLRQAAAGVGRTRSRAERGHRLLSHLHARSARHYRQPRRHQSGAAAVGRPPGRRRSVSGRRRRQGHGDVLRHRKRHRCRLRFLARRCLRVRRQPGLRPQADGDHRPWRLGLGRTPLPRGRHRHRRTVHRHRRRRYVG